MKYSDELLAGSGMTQGMDIKYIDRFLGGVVLCMYLWV